MKQRLHVISIANTQTTKKFNSCAYTQKVMKFCRMMLDQGHEVFLYSGDVNEAPCTKHFACIREAERNTGLRGTHYTLAPYGADVPHWKLFASRAIKFLKVTMEPQDVLCVIAGAAHQPIANAFPAHVTCEFGIGYGGTFADYRVFESYAWMHTVYGHQAAKQGLDSHGVDGRYYDCVIPNSIDPADFPEFKKSWKRKDYMLYMGRMIDRKGLSIVYELQKATGCELKMAGTGNVPAWAKPFYVGEANFTKRAKLMAEARCVIMPTVYVEPFGAVAIEAMASGTPVITTDWGAFTETVQHGKTGFRCHTLKDFVTAYNGSPYLDRADIRAYALSRFGFDAVGAQYSEYFARIADRWKKGWYEL